jgi:hypothetical protein
MEEGKKEGWNEVIDIAPTPLIKPKKRRQSKFWRLFLVEIKLVAVFGTKELFRVGRICFDGA